MLPLDLQQVQSVAPGAALPPIPPVDKSALAWEPCSNDANCVKPRGHLGWCIQTAGGAVRYLAAGGPEGEAQRRSAAAGPSTAAQLAVELDTDDAAEEEPCMPAVGGRLQKARKPGRQRSTPPVLTALLVPAEQQQQQAVALDALPDKCSLQATCPKPAGHNGFCIATEEGAAIYNAKAAKGRTACLTINICSAILLLLRFISWLDASVVLNTALPLLFPTGLNPPSIAALPLLRAAMVAAPQRPRSKAAAPAAARPAAAAAAEDPALVALKNRKPQYVHVKQNVWVSKPRPK